jgi:hypothetical protein
LTCPLVLPVSELFSLPWNLLGLSFSSLELPLLLSFVSDLSQSMSFIVEWKMGYCS